MHVQSWIEQASRQISQVIDDNTLYEAKLLAAEILQCPLSKLRISDDRLSNNQLDELNQLLQRRLKGEPIAYILGEQSFFDLNLKVNQHTLIPRPETEILVENILGKMADYPQKILDLGTGSGAIACAIANKRPDCQIIAADISAEALSIAQYNGEKYHLKNITWQRSNWFDAITYNDFDFIISNPPYIADNDAHLSLLQYEPQQALISCDEGYSDLYLLIQSSADYLKNKGWLYLEHGYQQGLSLRDFASQISQWRDIQTIKDYGQCERITFMQKNIAK